MDSDLKNKSNFGFFQILTYLLYLANFILILNLTKNIFNTKTIESALDQYTNLGPLVFKAYSGIIVILIIYVLIKKPSMKQIDKFKIVFIINIFLTALSYPLATWIVVLINSIIR
ncbi:hypothetical protein A2954_04645 [Candidatus Roizmanbacteria bacterium RIFCSPLOWO2_01_FULL_37_12]|uniref:DUF5658 domain-containing protein n=1 Tax=Candidatus Roizmanbacteria bacterium RIFCSPLOWO2_01_FULL_37_12 TaxID=1802056 RepID=A0A1F7IG09_9BACT|nr:MAG: hypothetical protein A3D76_06145 [Candidatus Roizmanbacteria bacterium RIFCSPHIGHO2_02_FULL_37_9b]OGK42270.1 MAG: hypothetical protein A2954_04645 [Candidatus Roizmanbacteria bacterium RIFCSPLOWO2_01_FULL_37_12]